MRQILLALGLLVGFAAPARAAETVITILTSPPSGVYYLMGTTLSSIYGKAMPGANVRVQATAGSVEDLKLLEAGDGELGFTLGSILAAAWAGNMEAGFDAPFTKLRAIARIYPNFLHIMASNRSGMKTLADLKGKRVSIGPEGSGTAVDIVAICRAAGFTPSDLANFVHAPFTQSFRMIEQGTLDAAVAAGGLGVEYVRHPLASGQVTLVPVPPGVVAKLADDGFAAGTIPAGTYENQPSDLPTAVVGNFLVTREGVSDDVAYMMTKSLFEHLDQLVQTHPAAKDIDVRQATVGLPIPLHPGAARYYREIGIVK
jgi:uncharacterized protein